MTKVQLEKLNIFLLHLVKFTSGKIIHPIYRGDNLQGLCNKLGIIVDSNQKPDYQELLGRLFMVGDKSKNYLSKEHFNFNRTWQFSVNESSPRVYDYIFDTISSNIKDIKIENVQKFFTENDSFKKYFLDKVGNKEKFSTSILKLPVQKQISIRNYYLKLIHQIGSINYRERSVFISTSQTYSIAKGFATGKKIME